MSASVSKSGDFGFTGGTYVAKWKGTDGKMATENGKHVTIWAKNADGDWKAIQDIWNSDAK